MADPGRLSDEALTRRLRESSPLAAGADPLLLGRIVPIVRERLRRLEDFDEVAGFLLVDRVDPPHDALIPEGRTDTNTAALLRLARERIARGGPMEPDALEADLRALADDADWKPEELFASLRWAVAGRAETPPLAACMSVLGRAACIERIDAAIDVLGSPENPILGAPGLSA